jgi:hypothetical protein
MRDRCSRPGFRGRIGRRYPGMRNAMRLRGIISSRLWCVTLKPSITGDLVRE